MKSIKTTTGSFSSQLLRKAGLSLMAAMTLVGCSNAPAMMLQRAPLQAQQAQSQMQSMAASQVNANQVALQGPIQIAFVKAYGRTAVENEAISRKDPNSPSLLLIRMIDGATRTLDGSFYDIDNADVVNALLRAKQRGVKVRLVTDTDNMTAKNSGPTGPARPAIVALQKAGIPIVDDKRSGIMHNKFLVVDNKAVWTGSTNLTDSSLYQHNNNALTLSSPQLAASYTSEFERLFTQKIFGPNPARQVPYPSVKIGNTQVDVFFSPRGGGQQAVLATLRSAKKRVLFMTFSLTDDSIGEIVKQKLAAGLKVEGVFDSWLGASKYSLYSPLRESGMNVRKDGNSALLHHKVIIVDDTVITGSYNYSNNAENSNNENFLILRNSPAIAKAYVDEFERIQGVSRPGTPRPDWE